MKMIKLTKPDGTPITSWEEWTRPKKEIHWKAGRSAMELAKAWFRNDILSPPQELLSLLNSTDRLKGIDFISGVPELVTSLPERGEGRNHDLALVGKTENEQITVCIEAKADESFGSDTVSEYWNKAKKRRGKGESTRVPERIQSLLKIVGENEPVLTSKWRNIRYQLLTAISGTILQSKADHSSIAVLVVHEFRSTETSVEKQNENHDELVKLLSLLSRGRCSEFEAGSVYGPFHAGGGKLEIMVGKIITTL